MVAEACKLSGRQGEDVTPEDIKNVRDARPLESKFNPATDVVIDLSGADVATAEVDQEQEAAPRSTIVACPEHSHPGESQSNGKAEAAVKTLVNQARTLKVALESRLKRERERERDSVSMQPPGGGLAL